MGKKLYTVGIDLGGTSTRVGVFDLALNVVDSEAITTPVSAGPDKFVAVINQIIEMLLERNGLERHDIVGIGVGSPGPLNVHDGVLGMLPNLPGYDLECPIFCAVGCVSVAQLFLSSSSRRRGGG
jgi:glucokinase